MSAGSKQGQGMGFDVDGGKGLKGGRKDNANDKGPPQESAEQAKESQANESPAIPKVSQQGTPACPRHNCVMRATTTAPLVTHYKCPVEGCEESSKQSRHRASFFRDPMYCPLANCRDANDKKPVALELDKDRSTAFSITMKCPKCTYHIAVPNPALAQTRPDLRPKPPDLGER